MNLHLISGASFWGFDSLEIFASIELGGVDLSSAVRATHIELESASSKMSVDLDSSGCLSTQTETRRLVGLRRSKVLSGQSIAPRGASGVRGKLTGRNGRHIDARREVEQRCNEEHAPWTSHLEQCTHYPVLSCARCRLEELIDLRIAHRAPLPPQAFGNWNWIICRLLWSRNVGG
jgi:hypothetical protein